MLILALGVLVVATAMWPLVASLTDRYNYGCASSRNADRSKTAPTGDDLKALSALNDVKLHVRRSLATSNGGDYGSAAGASRAASAAFEWARPALAANASDADLNKDP